MQHFRFRLPSFFSSDSPRRVTSASASTTPPPPPPPRPPFRPAGVAQPSSRQKPLKETESKASPLTKRKSSRKAAAMASSSASLSSSRGSSTSSQHEKEGRENRQAVSLLKKPEPIGLEEPKKVAESKANDGGNVKGVDDAIKETHEQKTKEEDILEIQETQKVDSVGKKDERHSRIIGPVAAAMEHVRTARDKAEMKTRYGQHKTERLDVHGNDDDGKNTINLHVNRGGEGSSMSKAIKEDINEGISKLSWGKNNPNNDEKPVTVMTLTGENRGATMQIASDKAKSDSTVHIHRGYKSKPDESPSTTSTDNEQGRNFNALKYPKDEESLVKTYVNCNSQSINNSIVFQSSVAEHDPGAHVSVRIEEAKNASKSPEKKPETTLRPPPEKKAANEPRLRRRCLRGLLAESSESETENPQKPRRHGCRFSCKGKGDGVEIF